MFVLRTEIDQVAAARGAARTQCLAGLERERMASMLKSMKRFIKIRYRGEKRRGEEREAGLDLRGIIKRREKKGRVANKQNPSGKFFGRN